MSYAVSLGQLQAETKNVTHLPLWGPGTGQIFGLALLEKKVKITHRLWNQDCLVQILALIHGLATYRQASYSVTLEPQYPTVKQGATNIDLGLCRMDYEGCMQSMQSAN